MEPAGAGEGRNLNEIKNPYPTARVEVLALDIIKSSKDRATLAQTQLDNVTVVGDQFTYVPALFG